MPNPCHFLQSCEVPRVSQAEGLPRHREGKDPLPLLQDKYFAAAGVETARQQLLDNETKTQCHYAPPAPAPPCLTARPAMRIKDGRVRRLTKPAKGEQQQLVVIRDFLLERATK